MLDHFICHYDMMAMNQTLFSPNGEAIKVRTQDFIKALCSFIDLYENYDVRLEGNVSYLNGLVRQIQNYYFVNYHNKPKPHITINGGR